MKSICPILLLVVTQLVFGQTSLTIQPNEVRATFNASGDLYASVGNFGTPLQAPRNNPNPMFSLGQIWIGGYDPQGQLHIAAQTYRQGGSDFWSGPLDTTSAVITATANQQWNTLWAIRKTMIDSFIQGYYSQTPVEILNWPGNGNPQFNQAKQLAPFEDINNNGIYEPASGEYPLIIGDAAVYFIYNDHLQNNLHAESGGRALGVEIHGMAYALNCPSDSVLNNTIFLKYKIYNRSDTAYTNCYIGKWLDFDLSTYNDDHIGTDTTLHLGYFYDSGSDAWGLQFLNTPLSYGIGSNNNFSAQGNPTSDVQFYNYLTGKWADGSPLTYGGTGYGGNSSTTHIFTGNPFLLTGWLDTSNVPADKRYNASTGPFNFLPDSSIEVHMALLFAKDYNNTGAYYNTQILRSRAAALQAIYLNDSAMCGGITTVAEPERNINTTIYPNPTHNLIFVETIQLSTIQIMDAAGAVVMHESLQPGKNEVNIEHLPSGFYFVLIHDQIGQQTNFKLIKN